MREQHKALPSLNTHTINDEQGLLAQGQLGTLRDDMKVVGNDELVTGEVEVMGEGTGFTTALLSPSTEQQSASTTAHAFDPTLNLCQGPTISLLCSSISPISRPLTCLTYKDTNLPMNYRGNASTFENSPMARLLEEYTGGMSDDEPSTETLVTLLVTMIDLEADNIKKVEDLNRGTMKYKLSDSLMESLHKTTVELQLFVGRAAGLLGERDVNFTIDPKDTLLHILRGTTSLAQLHVAWKVLLSRMRLGVKTWEKYIAEYQLQVGPHC